MGVGGGRGGEVCRLANYSVAYEETQSNRVSYFRDFVCFLFPKAILFDFYFTEKRKLGVLGSTIFGNINDSFLLLSLV